MQFKVSQTLLYLYNDWRDFNTLKNKLFFILQCYENDLELHIYSYNEKKTSKQPAIAAIFHSPIIK